MLNNKKSAILILTIILSLTYLSIGCVTKEDEIKANKVGESVYVRENKGETNSTKITVYDYKFVEKIKTNEKTITPQQGKKFLIINIETAILIEKNEISLEINNKEIKGINSGNMTFKIDENKSNFKDYLNIVQNPPPLGLYPGADLDGWIIFPVNKSIALENTYFKVTPDIVGNNTLRWSFE